MKRVSVYFLGAMVTVFGISTSIFAQRVAVDPRAIEAAASARAAHAVLERLITLQLHDVDLKVAIHAIARSAGLRVQYANDVFTGVAHPVTLAADRRPLGTVLEQVLHGTPLRAIVLDQDVLGIKRDEEIAQDGQIAGRVVDAQTKRPVRGAMVTLDGATRGVSTGEDGAFLLSHMSLGSHRITVRMIGYVCQEKPVTVTDAQRVTVDFALESSVNTLDQVVVTGTVVQTELKAVPNAITVITAKQIEERGITRIDQLFRGDIPGLFVQNGGSANALDQVTMFSRGASSLGGSGSITNPIKTYVDGVEIADPSYLSQIDPKSIERIEILTGPQASTIYGSNAINGVMQIFTKRGMSNAPQLTLNLSSGWAENNFSNARTPQHDDALQISGTEGRASYSAGGSWNFIGAWTPAKRTARTSGFGAWRMPFGSLLMDISGRLTTTRNQSHGNNQQAYNIKATSGIYTPSSVTGIGAPTTSTLTGQTFGITVTEVVTPWWSHELVMGSDKAVTEVLQTTPMNKRGNGAFGDTLLAMSNNGTTKTSMRYSTTISRAVLPAAQVVVTLGVDHWHDETISLSAQPLTLTGNLASPAITRDKPLNNTGGFFQGQLGLWDAVFLTYGLRAEWNPNYGAEAQPNMAPRYGIAYTSTLGGITAKLRASYGRATRPPSSQARLGVPAATAYGSSSITTQYGTFDAYKANPELEPEVQQGGEGGLEVYWGRSGSIAITRYNQTVDKVIVQPLVDSVRSLVPFPTNYVGNLDPSGFGYLYQFQNLNIGSLRNQGWELQGSVNTGPFVTKGTYSWTKSRVIGITPKYQAQFPASNYPQYQPGVTFVSMPEHTWAMDVTYARATTAASLVVNGVSFLYQNLASLSEAISFTRLQSLKPRMNAPTLATYNPGYYTADLNFSYRVSPLIETIIQGRNLTNVYQNDLGAAYASIGRQVNIGVRVRP